MVTDLRGDDEVLRALVRRREAGSRPGERRDPHRIALRGRRRVRVERASHLGHAAAVASVRRVDPTFRAGPDEFPASRRSPLP